jgi:hypothetical protein
VRKSKICANVHLYRIQRIQPSTTTFEPHQVDLDLVVRNMIGVDDIITNTGTMDRKRRRIMDSNVHVLSTPPKWHSSLKRHFNIVEEYESTSICDVAHLLVDSGYVNVIDINHLSQTCTKLHRVMNRQAVWLSLCEHEFPGSTKVIPHQVLKERGYKWLYRNWTSTIQNQRHTYSNTTVSLPPPRLSPYQIMMFVQFSRNEFPLHNVPICLTGDDLTLLLNAGKMTLRLSNPVMIDTTVQDDLNGLLTSTYEHDVKNLNIRMHLLSIPDATMCCIFDQSKESTMIQIESQNDDETYIDFGPNDIHQYYTCELPLRHTPNAIEIKKRLSYHSIMFHVGLYFGIIHKNQIDGEKHDLNHSFGITGLDIQIRKYNNHQSRNICTVFDSSQMNQNGGVTVCHYVSELQMS